MNFSSDPVFIVDHLVSGRPTTPTQIIGLNLYLNIFWPAMSQRGTINNDGIFVGM